MAILRTEALVLRSVDFSEADRILHLLVPEFGRLTVIAKHARRSMKRFAGNLDLFNHLRVQIDRKPAGRMSRIDQARLVHSFEPLRTDPSRFALGCYLLEMLDRMAPEGGNREDMQRLFRFATGALAWLAAHPPDARARTFLELRALDALGLRPELSRCVRCGREPEARDEVDFHVADGGPLCGACAVREFRRVWMPIWVGDWRSGWTRQRTKRSGRRISRRSRSHWKRNRIGRTGGPCFRSTA